MGIGKKTCRGEKHSVELTGRLNVISALLGYFLPQERKHLSMSRWWLEGLVTWNSLRSLMDPTL